VNSYESLATRFDEIGKLQAISGILYWDSKTMMPPAGAASRGEHMGTLTAVIHDKSTDPALGDLLDDAEAEHNELTDWQRANLREMRRQWRHANATPSDLAIAFAKERITAAAAWVDARADNNFAAFAPRVKTIFDLQRQIAAAKAQALGVELYDALLDQYDPGTRCADVDHIFADLASFLPDTVRTIQAGQAARTPHDMPPISADQQVQLIRRTITHIGWPENGRIDHTEHPFAMAGVPGDPRITTHFDESNPHFALLAAFHEAGHGLYELHLPKNEFAYQPVGKARGTSTHEAQSLGVEMQACRSDEFLFWFFPLVREAWDVSGPAWTDENLHGIYRRVAPSLIRVHADEVTYPLHVILRYRLERALLDGDLTVDDLPGAWDDNMEQLLGVRPTSLAEGCLQDIHWSMGLIGYFPTYTLGALKAAQFFAAAKRADPSLLGALTTGNFKPWVGWLRDNVHRHASYYDSDELMVQATGSTLDVGVFKRHITQRYCQ
jgi:carboxypeptidase Taq